VFIALNRATAASRELPGCLSRIRQKNKADVKNTASLFSFSGVD